MFALNQYKSMCFGKRLNEERKKTRLNQTDFAKIGGVTKTSQFNYESGIRSPSVDYWQAISRIGVDIQYILIGVRNTAEMTQKSLTLCERNLLNNYANTDEMGKKIIEATAFEAAQQNSKRRNLKKTEFEKNGICQMEL